MVQHKPEMPRQPVAAYQIVAKFQNPPTANSGPPPVGLPLRQKAKGAAALEGRAGVEWGVLAALAA